MASEDPTLQLHLEPVVEDPLVGAVVNGKYRVIEVVATGGMGRIYRAEQLPLGRIVALKLLHQRFTAGADEDGFRRRFLLEASILSSLQHRNIVTVFDCGRIETSDSDAYFMVMEFLDGETLQTRLNRVGPMQPKNVIPLFRQLASGLRYAHSHDAIHRDLKPSNVMLVPQDDGVDLVKIVDFGLVKVLRDDSDQVTKEGTFLGSPRYMSPEQISRGQVDHRTDIYSLGVMLFQVLCGAVPFDSDQAVKTLVAHIHSPIPRMKERNPEAEVPAALEGFVRRCMEKDPAKRVASMRQVFVELGEIGSALGLSSSDGIDQDTGSGRLPIDASRTIAPLAEPTHHRRSRRLVVGAVVLGLASVGLAGWRSLRAENPTLPPLEGAAVSSSEPRAQFTLRIESIPDGAELLEGDRVLGNTPFGVVVNNHQAREQPRRLTLRKQGFLPYAIEQGASEVDERVVANLVPEPAGEGSPAVSAVGSVKSVSKRPVPAVTAKQQGTERTPDPDIRLQR